MKDDYYYQQTIFRVWLNKKWHLHFLGKVC